MWLQVPYWYLCCMHLAWMPWSCLFAARRKSHRLFVPSMAFDPSSFLFWPSSCSVSARFGLLSQSYSRLTTGSPDSSSFSSCKEWCWSNSDYLTESASWLDRPFSSNHLSDLLRSIFPNLLPQSSLTLLADRQVGFLFAHFVLKQV